MKPVNIGLLGLGTVGGGTAAVLQDNAAEISRRLGREVRISAVCDLSEEKARQTCPSAAFVKDPFELVAREDVDVVVELFGGTSIAKDAVLKAIENGKHIVTANKKLLAEYGNEIFPLAEEKNVMVQFEAAVAGGIPIIKALREGLAANRIRSIAGIINGTSNFILSEMREKGSAFADVLKEAQALGYAEADPTNDVGGFDAARKITLLSRLAYDTRVDFHQVSVKGIDTVDASDIAIAAQAGYTMKLLGKSTKTAADIQVGVEPVLLPNAHPLSGVSEAFNAVYVEGNAVGQTMFWGPGAGSLETASAVVSDILQIADRGFIPAVLPSQELAIVSQEAPACYYLRFDAPASHVRAVLQTLEIGYLTLAEAPGLTIKTEAISPAVLAKLEANATVVARYLMV